MDSIIIVMVFAFFNRKLGLLESILDGDGLSLEFCSYSTFSLSIMSKFLNFRFEFASFVLFLMD